MKVFLYCKTLLLLTLLSSSVGSAGVYVELSPSLVLIDTDPSSSRPLLADFRLGYEASGHQFELAIMSSLDDDRLNQLTVDIPSVQSVFYHYLPDMHSSLKLHFILGASQVDVESSYPGMADTSDHFSGVSYGFGLEEAFRSIPQLRLTLDWVQLYHGKQLNINATSLGIHYEF